MSPDPLGGYVDSHAHLDDDQFTDDLDDVLRSAAIAGIRRVINVGYRPGRWESSIAIADRYPGVAFTLGLHPHHADLWSPETERSLLDLIAVHRPVAIGEIGLDYFRNHSPAPVQRRVFARQLEVAVERDLPVVIHMRSAEDDMTEVLERAPYGLRGVLHSFDGTALLAELAVERGWYFGVGGLMTRSSSAALRQVLASVPMDRLLLETDSPYLAPIGATKRRNEPANLPIIARELGRLTDTHEDEIARVTAANAERLFGLGADEDGRRRAVRESR